MRVLLCLHHRLNPDAGAPGATLALGAALQRKGCAVEYFGYEQAFPRSGGERAGHKVRFPWRVAYFLARNGKRFDVVDTSTGDAWLWGTLGRPGAARPSALLTRSHGLEHLAHEAARSAAREVGPPLSWKYPLYHGGLRLWEVRRSLLLADHCILLNTRDRDYTRDRLGVPSGRLSVIPNGIADHFHHVPASLPPAEGPLRLAFIGRWTTYKGKHTLVEALKHLSARGVAFHLSILGSGDAPVMDDFPRELAGRISATPAFSNERLPELLAGSEVFVFPSLSEGSSASLIEAMACGLAPVASSVGAAPEVIRAGENGLLVPVGDAVAIEQALADLAADRPRLERMRLAAQQTARGYRWDRVAGRTLELYERLLHASAPA